MSPHPFLGCPGTLPLLWSGKAETCLNNLAVLKNKINLAYSTVSMVGLPKRDWKVTFLRAYATAVTAGAALAAGVHEWNNGSAARRRPVDLLCCLLGSWWCWGYVVLRQ